MTPDLLLDQGANAETSSEEEEEEEEKALMQTIYSILRQGCAQPASCLWLRLNCFFRNIFILFFFFFLRTTESDVAIRHKVKVIFQKIQHLQVSRFLLRKNVSLSCKCNSLRTFSPQQSKERLQEESTREKREFERKMAELQAALQAERRVSQPEGREMWKQVIRCTKKNPL